MKAMKWILFIMLFITPAANVTKKQDKVCLMKSDVSHIEDILECRPKFESERIWSLQTTSQMELESFQSCVRKQDTLLANANVASTMTMRSWCFCESSGASSCPNLQALAGLLKEVRNCEKNASENCQAKISGEEKGFVTEKNEIPKGQTSSEIRLYPP
jgi:hypothetical protein